MNPSENSLDIKPETEENFNECSVNKSDNQTDNLKVTEKSIDENISSNDVDTDPSSECINTSESKEVDALKHSESSAVTVENNLNDSCSNDTENDVEVSKSSNSSDSLVKNSSESESVTGYDPKHVHYEGDVAVYRDQQSGYEYIWNKDTEEWTLRNSESYGFEDGTHTFTDKDGVKYFWDKEKSAWFPKIDDEFMAMYQLNYGFVDNTAPEEKKEPEKPKEEVSAENKGQKRKPKDPEWFEVDDEHNTNVYVSNLPLDITEQEFVDLMQKCGLVMRDPQSGKMKIKLYTEKGTNYLKGDALCTYIKKESVDLALDLLDGYTYKDHKIKVERAKFQMKGEYDPSLKPKRKKKDKEKFKKMQQKLFDWRPERLRGQRAKHEKVVIIKNAFEPSMFDQDVGLILEIQQDLREEASKCGEVRKVVVFDRHPEGVVQVNMKSAEEADEVVTLFNGRWYNKRQITAETWDGKTKYRIAETDSEISKRLDKWSEFLEGDENPKSDEKAPKQKEETEKVEEKKETQVSTDTDKETEQKLD